MGGQRAFASCSWSEEHLPDRPDSIQLTRIETDAYTYGRKSTVAFRFEEDRVAVPGGRGAARETAILRAALELLAESGYDQLTIDAVAARARSSKATIYRRWPDKAALVVTAVRRHAGQPAVAAPDTGGLRSDLQAALQLMRTSLSGQDAALILGLLSAMHRDPELAGAVREQVLRAKREVFDAVITRAAARGDVPATTDSALLAEICSAVLFSRLLVTGEPLDDAFTQHLVDAVLLPALGWPST